MSNEYIDAGADHGILEVLPYLNYTPASALAEFVDNSVQSYINDKALLKGISNKYKLRIKITVSKNKKQITISDNAGGIADKDWQRALKAAAKPAVQKKGSLNEFGMGMKCAAYWFSRKWTIQTKSIREKVVKTVDLDLDKIKVSKDGKAKVNRVDTGAVKRSGTLITLKNCQQTIGKHESFIEKLESIHRNFLNDEIEIIYEAEGTRDYSNPPYKLSFKHPEFSKERPKNAFKNWLDTFEGNYKSDKAKRYKPDEIHWKIPINITFGVKSTGNHNKFIAKGYVAKLVKSGNHRGLYYFRRKKLLEGPTFPEAIFSSANSSSYQNKYIYGEIHFENVSAVFTKNAMSINEDDKFDFERKLNEIFRDTNKFSGTSFWEQLGVGIDGYESLVQREKLLSKGVSTEDIDSNEARSFKFERQFEAIKKGSKYKDLNRKPDDPVSTGHKRPPTIIEKKEKIKIDGIPYRIVIKTTWDEDYFDSWLQYQVDKKNKKLIIQIALSHVFFKQYFLDAATNEKGRYLIRDGIVILSEFIVSSTIYAISNMGVKKAESVLNNLNSILRELPPSDKRKELN